ncbi:hypothetical protein BJV74DRAFT_989524 [Russula compacta]|nr:hypothetical protein BJV74DRAFT_989524 [Russula compacta]
MPRVRSACVRGTMLLISRSGQMIIGDHDQLRNWRSTDSYPSQVILAVPFETSTFAPSICQAHDAGSWLQAHCTILSMGNRRRNLIWMTLSPSFAPLRIGYQINLPAIMSYQVLILAAYIKFQDALAPWFGSTSAKLRLRPCFVNDGPSSGRIHHGPFSLSFYAVILSVHSLFLSVYILYTKRRVPGSAAVTNVSVFHWERLVMRSIQNQGTEALPSILKPLGESQFPGKTVLDNPIWEEGKPWSVGGGDIDGKKYAKGWTPTSSNYAADGALMCAFVPSGPCAALPPIKAAHLGLRKPYHSGLLA